MEERGGRSGGMVEGVVVKRETRSLSPGFDLNRPFLALDLHPTPTLTLSVFQHGSYAHAAHPHCSASDLAFFPRLVTKRSRNPCSSGSGRPRPPSLALRTVRPTAGRDSRVHAPRSASVNDGVETSSGISRARCPRSRMVRQHRLGALPSTAPGQSRAYA